ncbi:c-type cytochrome [Salinisphaera sp. T31B1]|uniref:c-type cytochrome n=1 Tax=Salinisphaera sp. T31B1 TaxID=727963 RepID=UPI0033423536
MSADAPIAQTAAACTACHGTDGRSTGAIPSLAGMDTHVFIQRMQAFKQGRGTIMNRIAPGYDDARTAALAAYFAQQTGRETSHDEARDTPGR